MVCRADDVEGGPYPGPKMGRRLERRLNASPWLLAAGRIEGAQGDLIGVADSQAAVGASFDLIVAMNPPKRPVVSQEELAAALVLILPFGPSALLEAGAHRADE